MDRIHKASSSLMNQDYEKKMAEFEQNKQAEIDELRVGYESKIDELNEKIESYQSEIEVNNFLSSSLFSYLKK